MKARFPDEVLALQLNRFCGSGQQAIHFAAQAIASGDIEMSIGCGVESMSRVPMGSDNALTEEFRADFPCQLLHQGISAEMISEKWGITREELDEFAAQSHIRAGEAECAGWTKNEFFELNGLNRDEGVRGKPDMERMRKLKPVFRPDGVVTAANASQISDGAGSGAARQRPQVR